MFLTVYMLRKIVNSQKDWSKIYKERLNYEKQI